MINTSKSVYMNISELKDELTKRNINMTDSEIAVVKGLYSGKNLTDAFGVKN